MNPIGKSVLIATQRFLLRGAGFAAVAFAILGAGCATQYPAAPIESTVSDFNYHIGTHDVVNVIVWRNPELGAKVQVRPDGRITTPLIADLPATGRTPAQLADDIKGRLSQYVTDPNVSVIVDQSSGTYSQQVRVVGATEKPASLPYRANMTLLDAMISVGGLNQYAAGNRARLVRFDKATGKQVEYQLKIGRLPKEGDTSANVALEPGDVIIIPESMF